MSPDDDTNKREERRKGRNEEEGKKGPRMLVCPRMITRTKGRKEGREGMRKKGKRILALWTETKQSRTHGISLSQ